MSHPKAIRCEKCQVVMRVRHYALVHRRTQAPDGACPPVPCVVCREPVSRHGLTAFGNAVCSARCFSHAQGFWLKREALRTVKDQLEAMRRAQKLPYVYERRSAS